RVAADIAPRDPNVQFGYALTLQKKGDLQDAVARFRTAIELNHESYLARLGLASALKQLGNNEEAISIAADGLGMLNGDGSPEAYYQCGFLLRELNALDAAERAFRAAIGHNREYALAYSHLGGVLGDQGRWIESVEVQESAVRLGLRTADAYFGLGYALRMIGQLARAEAAYRESIAIDPLYSQAYSHLGGVLGDLGRWAESREVQMQSVELGENTATAHYGLGFANYKLRLWIEAEKHLRLATQLDNNHAWAFSYLGGALVQLRRFDDALGACLHAIQLKGDNPTFYFTLGLVYRKKRDLAGAEQAFCRATELNPEFALAWSYLGSVRGLLGLWEQAVEACKAAVALNPGKAEMHFGLGRALFHAGLTSAAHEYRAALDLKPEHALAREELERVKLLLPPI
ncbi:MAG TPA: tetratricopeptide repeat protein, partial [Longimicrobium sp.]